MDTLKRAYQKAAHAARYSILRHPARSMADTLRLCARRAEAFDSPDVYGRGELIEQFESRMAAMLGKPAALFLPSGTLAQPMALRIYADACGHENVALHPSSHLVLHEQDGYQQLWGLQGKLVGQREKVLAAADLEALSDPTELAALVIELPMREIGGQLPSWDDLQQQVAWARRHGVAVHIDGARLWQCPAYYQRDLAAISALADSVYVSLYKDIGGIAGAILAGETAFIEQARIWARRAGGNLIAMYPYVLAAEQGLDDNLSAISEAVDYAQQLGPMLASIPSVNLNPTTPQAAMFHLHIDGNEEALIEAVTRYAEQYGILVLPMPRAVAEHRCVFEVSVGRNAMAKAPEFWLEHLANCLAQFSNKAELSSKLPL